MRQMKLGDFIKINHVKDFSINGKCSMCGECCGAILPVSEKEIKRIKKYVVEHNIKINVNPINTLSEKMIDLTFLLEIIRNENVIFMRLDLRFAEALFVI